MKIFIIIIIENKLILKLMKKENNKDNIKFLSETLLTPLYKTQEVKTISLQTFKIMRNNLKSEAIGEFLDSLCNYELDINTVDLDSYGDQFEFIDDVNGSKLKGYCAMDYFANSADIEKYVFKVLEDLSNSGMTWAQQKKENALWDQAYREIKDNY